jgi:hypothetical protein
MIVDNALSRSPCSVFLDSSCACLCVYMTGARHLLCYDRRSDLICGLKAVKYLVLQERHFWR